MNTQNNNTIETNQFLRSSNMQYYGPCPFNNQMTLPQNHGPYAYNFIPIQPSQNYISDTCDDDRECIPGGGF